MASVKRVCNWRVEVKIDPYYEKKLTGDQIRRRLNELQSEIVRHVDDVWSAEVEVDEMVEVCEFCETAWGLYDDESIPGPGCCDKAQDEWKRENDLNDLVADLGVPSVQR